MLKISHLHKKYGSQEAVKDVTFRVGEGEIYGLLGPNGSGKSTTLHSLVGIVRPTSGRLEICGHSSCSLEAKSLFGFVPDDLGAPEVLTGEEFLTFIRRLYGVEDRGKQDALVEIFDLGGALRKLIEDYSHGMKRKLQIVAALTHSPEVVIMDEPFRSLDAEATINLKRLLSTEKARGRAVLIATHDLLMAQHYCDRIGIVSKGEVVAEGAVEELLNRYGADSLEDVFLKASGLMERRNEVEKYFDHL